MSYNKIGRGHQQNAGSQGPAEVSPNFQPPINTPKSNLKLSNTPLYVLLKHRPTLLNSHCTKSRFTMLLKSLLLSTLAVTTLALPQVRRDASTVLDSINSISKESANIQEILSGFTASTNVTATALQLQAKSSTLVKDINSGTKTVSDASTLNESESAKVANAVVELSSTVFTLLDQFVAKKPVFDKAILDVGSASSLVKGDLKKLKSATDEYGDAASSKLSGDITKIAPLLVGDIDFHFAEAIDAFGSK
ncbi:unnamed protein product [Penicillium bialowiezense]